MGIVGWSNIIYVSPEECDFMEQNFDKCDSDSSYSVTKESLEELELSGEELEKFKNLLKYLKDNLGDKDEISVGTN